jgi:hypothetical protein
VFNDLCVQLLRFRHWTISDFNHFRSDTEHLLENTDRPL